MSQTCGNCKHFYCEGDGRCCARDDMWMYEYEDACEKFENQDKYAGTRFRQITKSPEVLAEKLVYCEKPERFCECASWRSVILGNISFIKREEAIAATVEKLKEVAE